MGENADAENEGPFSTFSSFICMQVGLYNSSAPGINRRGEIRLIRMKEKTITGWQIKQLVSEVSYNICWVSLYSIVRSYPYEDMTNKTKCELLAYYNIFSHAFKQQFFQTEIMGSQ